MCVLGLETASVLHMNIIYLLLSFSRLLITCACINTFHKSARESTNAWLANLYIEYVPSALMLFARRFLSSCVAI